MHQHLFDVPTCSLVEWSDTTFRRLALTKHTDDWRKEDAQETFLHETQTRSINIDVSIRGANTQIVSTSESEGVRFQTPLRKVDVAVISNACQKVDVAVMSISTLELLTYLPARPKKW